MVPMTISSSYFKASPWKRAFETFSMSCLVSEARREPAAICRAPSGPEFSEGAGDEARSF